MNNLLFGTAGIPIAAKGTDTASGIRAVRQLGLDAMELEFVQSVNISRENARKLLTGFAPAGLNPQRFVV